MSVALKGAEIRMALEEVLSKVQEERILIFEAQIGRGVTVVEQRYSGGPNLGAYNTMATWTISEHGEVSVERKD